MKVGANQRVYVYGYYGCGNVGDELLLRILLQRLLGLEKIGTVGVKCLVDPENAPDSRVFYDTCEQHMLQPGRGRAVRLISFLGHLWQSLRGIRCLIFGGGTLFHAENRSPRNLLVMASVAVLARLRGARVCALGVGVGRIEGWISRVLMSLILLLSSDFAVRDKTSLENCRSLICGAKARLTADMVFCLEVPEIAQSANSQRIGLAMAASALRGVDQRVNAGLDELRKALGNLEQEGWSLDGVVFQHLEARGLRLADTDIFDAIFPDLRKTNMQRLPATADTREIAEIFGRFDLVVGMRFHSLVLAALCGIPFVGVGNDHKLRDICSAYGMPYLALSGLVAKDVVSAVYRARDLRPDMEVTRSLSRLAAKNFDELERCFS
jgi:polysaccharide pyruvyl transferase WcaK-like protein